MPKLKNNHDMSLHRSTLNDQTLTQFCLKHKISRKYNPTAPQPGDTITDCPDGFIALYTSHFDFANVRLPLSLFLISFLKEYNLNISQLSPNSAIKVSHFEVMCRALGYEPSLPLFRRFFILTRYGDWYNVDKRRGLAFSCVSRASRNKNPWKDSFFWVSAEYSMPFKMHWRQPLEPLNIVNNPPHDTEANFDERLYHLLVNHALPLEGFPEHVLILTGVSRNWPYANAEPILKDGEEEIDLLKYIAKRSYGYADALKFTSRLLAENEEHVLERTKGVCFECGGDVGSGLVEPVNAALSSIKGKNVVGVSSTGGLYDIQGDESNTLLIQLVVTGNHNEPETVSEGQKKSNTGADVVSKDGNEEMGLTKYIRIKGFGDVDLTTRSLAEHEDIVLDRSKGVCHEGGPSHVQPDIEKSVLGPDTELDPMVVCNMEDVLKKEALIEGGMSQQQEASASCSKKRKIVVSVSTSSEDNQSHENKDDAGVSVSSHEEEEEDGPKPDVHRLNQAGVVKDLVGSVPEFLKWHEREAKKEAQLLNQISRYHLKMKLERAKNVKLSKKLKKLKDLKRMSIDKGKEVAEGEEKLKQAYEELELQREVVEKLNVELELKNEMADKLNKEFEVEKASRTQERVSLDNSLERVLSDRRWLIQEGFEYAINRLHKTGEYNRLLGAVQNNLWESGAHYGIEQGYKCCNAGVALEDVTLYKPEAHQGFLKAVYDLEHTRFPYVVALSQYADRTLDDLKALEPLEMDKYM